MKPKTVVLMLFAVSSFLSGALGQYFAPSGAQSPSDIPCMLAGVFLIFVWYRIDSEQRSYRRSVWLNISVVALAIFAMPYYFFRSRGIKGGFVASGVFLLACVASVFLTGAGHFATSALRG
ncbi:hypothetical protein I6J77_14050 [Rhodanobacter sp. FDAARGOS 1247]|uniref:hypothetical protein n=1 Tax=Rhodanobacter sp. FDAARGOS 1247 TaxID=2778082 RepID=UPI0019507D34|nr:hypothetical protein [Rhodanobacter sp. FDAARGOS 1247]QRP63226.1 hypothetical protein I6J77_14050 [Rhodanobacter sp. FDAARGOS 1247]